MSKHSRSEQPDAVACPICGEPAESGCIYGPDGLAGLRWRAGEPSVWGNVVTSAFGGEDIGAVGIVRGSYVKGIRCRTCSRVILECSPDSSESAAGLDLITQASDFEGDGNWDQALAIYRQVLEEPDYRSHHEYARNGIQSIEEKIRLSKEA